MRRSFVRFAALAACLALLGSAAGTAPAVTRAEVDQAVAALAAYKAGDDPAPVRRMQDLLQGLHGQEAPARRMEKQLVGLLAGDAGYEAKLQACQALGRIGTEACIPALETMLGEAKTTHLACWALQPNPSAEALAALRRGLGKAEGEPAVCIIGVLGHRRDTQALPLLAERATAEDPLVAGAAIAALGKIGTPKAAEMLAGLRTSVPKALRGPAGDAYLQCATRLAEAGATDRAARMFETVLADDVALRYHRGALLALMRYAGEKAIPHVLSAIRGIDPMMKAAAIANVPSLEGEGIVERLAAELPDQSADVQALLLTALADRGGPAARRVVADAVGAKAPEARLAAVKALGRVGNASSVPLLAQAAAEGKTGEEREAALLSLRAVQGAGVDEAIVAEMKRADPPLRADLIGVLHGRGTEAAVPALLDQAGGDEAEVRKAAFKALGHLAGPKHLPALLERLVHLKGEGARATAERAVVEVARKAKTPAAGSRPVLEALETAKGAADRSSLLRVLGGIGGAKALAAVTDALEAEDEAVRDAAVRALGAWPDASAVPALIGLAKTSSNRTYQVVALRGAARLLAEGGGAPSPETLAAYKDLMAAVARPEDAKLVLAGLADVPHPETLAMAVDCLDRQGVRGEAAVAVLKIGRAVLGADPEAVASAMRKLIEAAPNEKVRSQARKVLDQAKTVGDMLVGWQVAGPFTKRRTKFAQLLDTPFPPEQKGKEAAWRLCPLKMAGTPPVFELTEILGAGNHRAAYVRTWLRADNATDARLEAGSDDSIKIWLNGKVVHKDPAAGVCTMGEHKVNVRLEKGWNTLMMKIVQSSGPWQFCARLVGRDGEPLEGVTVNPHHGGK